MTAYVIVAAVRIQPWLTRTPRLRLMRGASAALTAVTSRERIEEWIPTTQWRDRAAWCEESGEVAGVVALIVGAAADLDEVRFALLGYLRLHLPGAEWVSWTGSAATFTEAREMAEANDSPTHLAAPASGGAPLAMSCEGCRSEAASELRTVVGEDEQYLGRDCLVRLDYGQPVGLRTYAFHLGLPGRQPDTFEDLARVEGDEHSGSQAFGAKRNHLATICADGNGVGRLFGTIDDRSDEHGGPELRRIAATAVDQATRDALTGAVHLIAGSSADTPAVVHFVGGDDVFVSVPAHLAWSFVLHLAQGFSVGHALAAQVGALPWLADELDQTSLGIGVVFAHASHPIAPAQRMAFQAMKVAKRRVGGTRAAVSWLDLTSETDIVPDRFRSISELSELRDRTGSDPRPRTLLGLPPAARSVLAGLTTEALTAWAVPRGQSPSSTPPPAVRQTISRLRQQADRNNVSDLQRWLDLLTVASAIPDRAISVHKQLCWLADTLSLARWWPERPPRLAGAANRPATAVTS